MKTNNAEPAAEEQRADDQDTAIEEAFIAGTLPEVDRREPDVQGGESTPVEEPCPVCAMLDAAGVGTTLERQLHGWKVKLMDGGTVILSEGATISLALHRS